MSRHISDYHGWGLLCGRDVRTGDDTGPLCRSCARVAMRKLRLTAERCLQAAERLEQGNMEDIFDGGVWLTVERDMEGRQGFARGGRQTCSTAMS